MHIELTAQRPGTQYCPRMAFTPAELELIETTKEVSIETRSGDRTYRTIIWAVVDKDKVYVRSFLGDSGKWYQRALADPEVALLIGETRLPVRAVLANDAESVDGASQGFLRKYPRGRSRDAMVVPEVLHTTLRLEPPS